MEQFFRYIQITLDWSKCQFLTWRINYSFFALGKYKKHMKNIWVKKVLHDRNLQVLIYRLIDSFGRYKIIFYFITIIPIYPIQLYNFINLSLLCVLLNS